MCVKRIWDAITLKVSNAIKHQSRNNLLKIKNIVFEKSITSIFS